MIMILFIMRLFTCVINRSAFCLLHGPAFLIKPDHGDDDNYNSDNSNDDNNTNDDDALLVLSRQLWWRITIPPTSFRASNGWWQALLAKVSDERIGEIIVAALRWLDIMGGQCPVPNVLDEHRWAMSWSLSGCHFERIVEIIVVGQQSLSYQRTHISTDMPTQ